jgi:hypothetical protein
MISHQLAIAFWERALRSKVGIGIETEDEAYLASTLYAARQAENNEELNKLSIVKTGKGELWIVHATNSN